MRFRLLLAITVAATAAAENWPQWRGPNLNGISGEKNLPTRWSPTENITWKLAMPQWTGSTPIIWGEHIFLNVADSGSLYLWCVDRNKGEVLWKKLIGGGDVKRQKQNMSSPSPVTDGKTVWVLTGTGVLKAFDFKGSELWARDIQKDYGAFGHNHGYGSSPLLLDGALYIPVLHGMKTDDPSYILKIDGKSGKTLWRMERPTDAVMESPDSYITPALLRLDGKTQLVISGGDYVTGHDLATGKELWRGGGMNPGNNPMNRIIASPVVAGDLIYVPTRVRPLQVYRAGGAGDITKSHIAWKFDNGPDVPTPVIDGKYFYSFNDRGIVWCLDARTGAEIYGSQRIKTGTYSSSAVLADGKLYIVNEDGVFTVLKAGPTFEILAENNMNDYTLSSVAISEGQLFLRTAGALWCVGKRVSTR